MKMAPVLGSSVLAVSLVCGVTLHAQNTPTRLTQPAVNAQAQNQADVAAEAQRDPRFTSRYGSARPTAAAPAPAAAPAARPPAAAPATTAVAVPGAPVPQAAPPPDDPRFTSRYGSARPRTAQPAVAPTATPVRPSAAAPAPGSVAAPVAIPAPVRQADPEREQRIINFQRQNAASGNPSAQYDLGMRYLRGNGVEQDDTQAMEWLKLAAQNGDGRAKKELAALQAKVTDAGAPAKAESAPEAK